MPPSLTRQEAERLVNTYADLILRLSYTYLSHTHDAQDICQTVFLKLIERRPAFASSEHEKAWIIRTTINACKDHLKSHWRKTTVPIEAAQLLGRLPSTVNTQLRRGREQLKTLLEKEGYP